MQVTSQTAIHSASPVLAIATGPTRIIRTSASLPWQGLTTDEQGGVAPASIPWYFISMTVASNSLFELRGVSGLRSTCLHRPGMIMVTPPGPVPDLRLLTPAAFVHCALEEDLLRKVVDESERQAAPLPVFQLGIRDKSIERLLTMMAEELVAEMPLGRLYIDSLSHALASRLLLLHGGVPAPVKSRVSALPPQVLKRVREKIEANIDGDLSLDNLAGECRYSRAHFLRMFHAATGLTPHQYVLGLRLKRAQERLLQKGSNIIDVAMSCGFSSQSHMTNAFKRHLEMTPAEFRRNA